MGEVVALKRQSRCFLRQELETDGKWVGTYQFTLLNTKLWLHLTENIFTPLAMALLVLTIRTSLSFHVPVTPALHPTANGLKFQPSLNMVESTLLLLRFPMLWPRRFATKHPKTFALKKVYI